MFKVILYVHTVNCSAAKALYKIIVMTYEESNGDVLDDVKWPLRAGGFAPAWRRLRSGLVQNRDVATGGYRDISPPKKKSAKVNFLWGKNDIRTAIQQFYTPKKTLYPQNKFLATPLASWW